MKILIIGGVAAGTKTAAKLKRADRSAEVTVLTKGKDISYAGCGLPYYVGGLIEERSELIVNTPQKFAALTGVNVVTGVEAVGVDGVLKTVQAKNTETGEVLSFDYDKLVIATGASAIRPNIEGAGLNGVFTVRTPDDAISIRDYVSGRQVKQAVVVGGGFIGLEMAENLKEQGVSVTVIDVAAQILPDILDPEMAAYVKRHLAQKGIRVLTNTKAVRIEGEAEVSGIRTDSALLSCGLVVMAVGIRPNNCFFAGQRRGA